ncbi:MAG: GGDEF domain-containing protein [Terracidiphilus sp.]|jgi:diguanylate cyclase (GGDEF)-like protein
MKRFFPAVAIILAGSMAAWAAEPSPLTALRAIHALSNTEAKKGLPVEFEATVTFFRPSEFTLFVQDDDVAIYVAAPPGLQLLPGDRVRVHGKTQTGFTPDVAADSITVLRHGSLPTPLPATFDDMIRTEDDCRLVTVHAIVHSADLHLRADMRNPKLPMHSVVRLQLLMEGGYIEAFFDSKDESALSGMLDAEVEATGVAGKSFDGKMEPTGAQLLVPSIENVKILKRSKINPWTLPVTPMNLAITGYHVLDSTQRIRVHGTITYYHPGWAAVIQDGARSMWIATQFRGTLHIGDQADAIGFPEAHNSLMALTRAEILDSNAPEPIQPIPVTWKQLTTSGSLYDLVSIEGKVVTAVREASQDEYVLATDGQLFTAIYRHDYNLPPMKQVPLGSMIRVTGICVVEDTNPFDGNVPFNILLRDFDDVEVIKAPSPLNIANLIVVVLVLLGLMALVGVRGWALERNVRRQTAVLSARTEAEAEIERQRSRILEDINGSRPLSEILDEIAQMVSSTLDGAPCWCEVTHGAILGNPPRIQSALRVVQARIEGRADPVLGTFFAGLNPHSTPDARETEALRNGARLATLAMETRRLYSDLRRRSEFDLLTDIPNRFAMEKFMELRIAEAGRLGEVLGLIYIDLDRFKPINDTYGHHVGDVYLQQVALRMNRQLLGGDLLARLGGDEFAALVTLHHGRADLDKIVARLVHCFDEPFVVEGIGLTGSASLGVAMYPENGTTRDSLLSAADAAMYAVKNLKHQAEKASGQELKAESAPAGGR